MVIEFMPIKTLEEGFKLLEKAIAGGHVSAAFGEPLTEARRTVIIAAEVSCGIGYGVGGGYGEGESPSDEAPHAMSRGGGGGGGSMARPVAAIIIEPERVRVEPVVDVTKVVLAFFTMFGSMLLILSKIRKAAK